ncbi:uncharacterized protein LOC142563455 [Dermacentor variabilis]|uniref:uncharacterized protein LOC142563455 n=1 Tax=Dermacentor variabilis TaxID=34621 RepID=UPI003F5B2549
MFPESRVTPGNTPEVRGGHRRPTHQLYPQCQERCHVVFNVYGSLEANRNKVYWGVRITCGDKTLTFSHRRKVIRTLRAIQSAARDNSLHDKPNQGKVMQCVAADPAGSHFMHTGSFTRFADWRFIHKARLNLLPLNGARPWLTGRDQRCRVCGYAKESLPHVLCHCMASSALYTARHNDIVTRLRTASRNRFAIMSENRPVGSTNLRPDIVLVHGEEAIILDVCCPFDNRLEAFAAARAAKVAKYEPVRSHLAQRYQRVTVDAIVIGALGSWDPGNDSVLRRLCSRSYLRLFKKLAVSDVISASRTIYHKHVAPR